MRKILTIFAIVLLSSFALALSDNSIPLSITVEDSNGNPIQSVATYNYTFNISSASDCSVSLYSNVTKLTTNAVGRAVYFLDNVSINFTENRYLQVMRDGVIKSCSLMGKIGNTREADNATYWQGYTPQTYNDTYINPVMNFINRTFNQSLTDILYSPIIWAYNQTIATNTLYGSNWYNHTVESNKTIYNVYGSNWYNQTVEANKSIFNAYGLFWYNYSSISSGMNLNNSQTVDGNITWTGSQTVNNNITAQYFNGTNLQLGTGALALGDSHAIGISSFASGSGLFNSFAFGNGAQATQGGVTFYGNATNKGIALGVSSISNSTSNAVPGIAIGTGTQAGGTAFGGAVAIGRNTKATARSSMAIGDLCTATNINTIILCTGTLTNNEASSVLLGTNVALLKLNATGADFFSKNIINVHNASILNNLTVGNNLDVVGNTSMSFLRVRNASNFGMDRCTLVSGACQISNIKVTNNTNIFCFEQTQGGTIGSIGINARAEGNHYNISSSNILDTSIVACLLIENAN